MRPNQGERFEPKNIGVNILIGQVDEINKKCLALLNAQPS
jgi:hypothetical protein